MSIAATPLSFMILDLPVLHHTTTVRKAVNDSPSTFHRDEHLDDRLPTSRPAAADEAAAREAVAGEHTSNHIVRSILGDLQERNLQPGDRLPSERALAEKLGVGRNALREALATPTTLRLGAA